MYERELKRLKKEFGDMWDLLSGYGAYIAGGAITSVFTNSDINDFDVYFESEKELSDFVMDMDGRFTVVSHTDKATLLIHNDSKIQLIRFDYFKTADKIFEKFDFTVCMGAYSFKDLQFYFHEDFFKHNSQRILRFNPKTAFPYISMLRIKKYESKGYSISKPEFARVMLSCSTKPIQSYEEAMEQLGGMYGNDLTSLVDGKEFSIEKLIDKLGNFDVSDINFNMPTIPSIEPSELVWMISKEKVNAYKSDDGGLAVINKKIIEVNSNDEFFNILSIYDRFKVGDKLYKWVNKTRRDNVFTSIYKDSFEYKIGQEVSDTRNGLWVSTLEGKDDLMYSSCDNSKLIELEVLDGCKFLGYGSNCVKATKLKVIRVVG